MPIDKLGASGCRIEIIDVLPFVVSLSNHSHDICKSLEYLKVAHLDNSTLLDILMTMLTWTSHDEY